MMENILTTLTKMVFIPSGLIAAADAEIDKKIIGSETTKLIISSKKIVKFPEDSALLIKCITETIENEKKEQNFGFLVMFLVLL